MNRKDSPVTNSLTRRLLAGAATAVLALTVTACTGGEDGVSVTAGPTASAAPDLGASLKPADFAAAAKRSGTTVLDVRTPQEFAEGHLEGAVNLDVENPGFATQAGQLDPTQAYAVYCHSGNRSKTAMSMMAQLGFTQLYDLDGGIEAWTSAGGATTR